MMSALREWGGTKVILGSQGRLLAPHPAKSMQRLCCVRHEEHHMCKAQGQTWLLLFFAAGRFYYESFSSCCTIPASKHLLTLMDKEALQSVSVLRFGVQSLFCFLFFK
ncbi:hypothetical protein ILYODFUR_006646 [Ilyodon furcidens]|uniref:Uncharacterized protein n=1 Tax=Ilyodon furcidens TaxID=33524 RepID=A0ABV0UF85_9TELE